MPTIETNGIGLNYVETGDGEETVVFSHSYLLDHSHFAAQIEALSETHRVVAFDHRAHGGSETPGGPFDLQAIVDDAIGLIEATESGPCHFVGLSTGGFVGMRIALQRRELLRSLVLMDTSSGPEPLLTRIKYEAMFAALRLVGWRAVIGQVLEILFSRSFVAEPAHAPEVEKWRNVIQGGDVDGLIHFGHAVFARRDITDRLASLELPVLVVVGEDDVATPPSRAATIVDALPDADFVVIPDGGHVCTVTHPEETTRALTQFIGNR